MIKILIRFNKAEKFRLTWTKDEIICRADGPAILCADGYQYVKKGYKFPSQKNN